MMPYETIERGLIDDVLKVISNTGSQSSVRLILEFVSRMTMLDNKGQSVERGSVVHREKEVIKFEVGSCLLESKWCDLEVFVETEGATTNGLDKDEETGTSQQLCAKVLAQGGDATGRRDILMTSGTVKDEQLYQDMQAVRSPDGA
jgi:hypothetical protein